MLDITTTEQFKALGHPVRTRLLLALGHEAATTSQLARLLGVAKGSVAHHLGVLSAAGIVRVASSRQVRGGTERYYERTSERIRVVGPDEAAHAGVLLHTVADEVGTAAVTAALTVRTLHLTAEQADQLGARLVELVDEARDAGPEEPRFRAVVAVFASQTP